MTGLKNLKEGLNAAFIAKKRKVLALGDFLFYFILFFCNFPLIVSLRCTVVPICTRSIAGAWGGGV